MNDEYYMNLALKEAKKAYRKNEVPVGSLVVLNNKIIGRGYNQKESKNDISSHAEITAIKKASKKNHDWRLNDAVLYVTMSPCPMCAMAIKESRIKKIVVGTINPDVSNQEITALIFGLNKEKPNVVITEKVLEKECRELVQKFFQEQRKKVKNK